jgi:hypothetical protein
MPGLSLITTLPETIGGKNFIKKRKKTSGKNLKIGFTRPMSSWADSLGCIKNANFFIRNYFAKK